MQRPLMVLITLLTVVSAMAETLTVYVSSEGPREGLIDILVFNSKKGFPGNPDKAFQRAVFPVTTEYPVACVITNLPYGTYSLSVLHDVNANSNSDKMLGFGPPREPVGFSNIKTKPKKKPHYSSTLFTFSAETNKTDVALWYLF